MEVRLPRQRAYLYPRPQPRGRDAGPHFGGSHVLSLGCGPAPTMWPLRSECNITGLPHPC